MTYQPSVLTKTRDTHISTYLQLNINLGWLIADYSHLSHEVVSQMKSARQTDVLSE
jgi:hypothetical protein